ncbi:MAG: M24 family metallopeptidase, partial [Pseudomonadota bacterium]
MVVFNDLCNPISTQELERRWAAVRAAMLDQNIDALLMQNSNSFHGGYVKYFTDIPAMSGGYQAVLFFRDEEMIVFRHGPPGESTFDSDDIQRGVQKVINRATFAAVDYTKYYHSDAVIDELRPRMPLTIGIVGATSMAHPFLDKIKNGNLSGTAFVEAGNLVDEIKAIKSQEELDIIVKTANMQDAAMEKVMNAVKPGMRNFELTALAQYESQKLGSEQGLFLAGSGPAGTPAPKMGRHMQNRKIQDGDVFTILIENNGPGGFYTEIGRTCVLGKASSDLLDEFEFTLQAQKFTLDMVNPGADPADILSRYNTFMRENGRA